MAISAEKCTEIALSGKIIDYRVGGCPVQLSKESILKRSVIGIVRHGREGSFLAVNPIYFIESS